MKSKSKILTLATVFALALLFVVPSAEAANFFTPVGTHDLANCSKIAGWAKDGDTTLPIQVHVYKNAPFPYGTHVIGVVANLYRSGLPFADKNHGFNITTPASLKTGCPVKLYIHAINADTNGNPVFGATNPLLNLTGKTIICGQPNPSCFPRPDRPNFP